MPQRQYKRSHQTDCDPTGLSQYNSLGSIILWPSYYLLCVSYIIITASLNHVVGTPFLNQVPSPPTHTG